MTDVAKVNRQTKYLYQGLWDVYAKTVRYEGFKGLYRGFVPCMGGTVLYRSLYFGLVFDMTKFAMPAHQDFSDASIPLRFGIAQSAASLAGYMAYPMDTVKRRLMMETTLRSENAYNSVWDCWKTIYLQDGIKGFYPGAAINLIRGTSAAIVLVMYDELPRVARYIAIFWSEEEPVDLPVD